MLKLCAKGHITGSRNCSFCRSKTEPIAAQRGLEIAMDKRLKRRISQSIREAGGIPVADLRHSYWLQAHTTRNVKSGPAWRPE